MASATSSAAIAHTGAPIAAVDSDWLVVPWFEGDSPSTAALDEATGGELGRALASQEFTGRLYDLFVTPATHSGWRARRIAFVGAGARSGFGPDRERKIAAAVGLFAREHRAARVAFVLRGDIVRPNEVAEFAQATAEGLTLSEFDAATYKTID